jgi:4-amino-4-deoxy-L-arabinose transferase-like glycosyltransferase
MSATVESASRPQPFALRWWMPFAVFLPTYVLRLWRFERVRNWVWDFTIQVPTSEYYSRTGLLGPDNWYTQPLKHLVSHASALAFGNDLLGWRMRDVLLSSLLVLLVFLVARRLFRTRFAAFSAAGLLALDPLNIALARMQAEDFMAGVFVMSALLLLLRIIERPRDWDMALMGVAIGLGVATRIHVLVPWALMLAAVAFIGRGKGVAWFARIAGYLVALPLAVYLAAYLPWFGRGFGLADWLQLQVDTFLVQGPRLQFEPIGQIEGARRWFTEWVTVGVWSENDGTRGVVSLLTNDPVVWAPLVPSIGWLMWRGRRERDVGGMTIAACFIAMYGLLVLSPRAIYLYSALSLLPYGFVALGGALDRLPRRFGSPAVALLVCWSVYLYPLTSALPVPLWPYEWLVRGVPM